MSRWPAIHAALALAAENHLFQVKGTDGVCKYRDHNDGPVGEDVVYQLLALGLIRHITGWEPHGPDRVRRRLDVSEFGLDYYLNAVAS